MPAQLAPGDLAPEISAVAIDASSRRPVRLSDYRGKTVILYFYPKDNTPGCTEQACALRDKYQHLLDSGAIIFGVSVDSPESHEKFIADHQLPFPLLSDQNHEAVEAYGVWVEKNRNGQKAMGTERSTFVIGSDGRIRSIFRKVVPGEHMDVILDDLRNFQP